MFEEYEDIYEPTAADEIFVEAVEKFKGLLSDEAKKIAQEARDAQKELSSLNFKIQQMRTGLEYAKSELESEKAKVVKYKMHDLPRALVNRMVAETAGGLAPGDKVWRIKEEWSYPKCPRCGGEKKLVARLANGEDALVRCPECDGSGTTKKVTRSIVEAEVSNVYMRLCFDDRGCRRWSSDAVYICGRENAIDPKELYRDEEEAKAALAEIEKEDQKS